MDKLFFIVDVFAEEKFAGNQLAVFLGGSGLTNVEMQKIAREMNYSETTFILSDDQNKGGYDVRIFTPEHEIPFAGHPTLGTAHIIRNVIAKDSPKKIFLNLKVGEIPVTCNEQENSKTIYWMKQIEPTFGKRLTANIIAPVIGLTPDEIDNRFPIEEVSTGLPHIIVPLKTLDSLKRAKIAKDKYYDLIDNLSAKNVLIFCPEPHRAENNISVRMFADYLGIPEDPATGSGNGCLAGYFVRYRYWGREQINIRSEQGYEIGRPSLLFLRAEEKDGKIEIFVGGNAITVASGQFI